MPASASCPPAPVPARSEPGHASAFKPTREAGRRGGESTARWIYCEFFCLSVFLCRARSQDRRAV
nr:MULTISPECIES: hypothetical protein [Kosakonia]